MKRTRQQFTAQEKVAMLRPDEVAQQLHVRPCLRLPPLAAWSPDPSAPTSNALPQHRRGRRLGAKSTEKVHSCWS